MTMLKTRQRNAEWMDAPHVDPRELERALGFIRRVNRFLGYTRASLAHLEHFSRHWKRGERIRIIDLATGSADIPRAILNWADRRGFDVHIVAIDLHEQTARLAAARTNDPRLRIVQADVLNLPFADHSFDYAHTAMFLHHLGDDDAVRVLSIMNRLSRRGIIAADLLRDVRAYRWIRLFTMLSSPMIRHDARVSVAQAFNADEVLAMRDRAGVDYAALHHHFGHRFVLAGEKCPANAVAAS
jgi:SAM-dependent methyltransferase